MVEAPSGSETHPTNGDLRPLVVAYRLILSQARIQDVAQGILEEVEAEDSQGRLAAPGKTAIHGALPV